MRKSINHNSRAGAKTSAKERHRYEHEHAALHRMMPRIELNWIYPRRESLTLMIVVALLGTTLCAATPEYHLLKTEQLGGVGAWDYLIYDALGDRLFVSRQMNLVRDQRTGCTELQQ
jgi:hypothetical protein